MTIFEVQDRDSILIQQLLSVWEDSVRATHLFLSDAEIKKIKRYLPQALNDVGHLVVAENAARPVAFMGAENERLKMLFLSPTQRGMGLGRRLLEYSIRNYGIREVAVNAQNPSAIGFYRHMGFAAYKWTDCDESGDPYPLLYMKRG